MTPVRFKQAHSLYNSGEIAGFEDDVAADLINRGLAAPVEAGALGKPKNRKRRGKPAPSEEQAMASQAETGSDVSAVLEAADTAGQHATSGVDAQ